MEYEVTKEMLIAKCQDRIIKAQKERRHPYKYLTVDADGEVLVWVECPQFDYREDQWDHNDHSTNYVDSLADIGGLVTNASRALWSLDSFRLSKTEFKLSEGTIDVDGARALILELKEFIKGAL